MKKSNDPIKVIGNSQSGHYANSRFDIRALTTTRSFFRGYGTGDAKHSGWNVYDKGTWKNRGYFHYLDDAKKFVNENSSLNRKEPEMRKSNQNSDQNYLNELRILCDHIYRAKSKLRAIRKPTYHSDPERTKALTKVNDVLDDAKTIVLRLFENEALEDIHIETP